jgi:hypothetical protein
VIGLKQRLALLTPRLSPTPTVGGEMLDLINFLLKGAKQFFFVHMVSFLWDLPQYKIAHVHFCIS